MKKTAIILGVSFAVFLLTAIVAEPGSGFPAAADDDTCMECHSSVDMVGDEKLVVDAGHFEGTPHGDMGLSCVDCHTQAAEVEDVYDHGTLGPASCETCHTDAVEHLAAGGHAPREGRTTPACATCHGEGHKILAINDPASPSNRLNQPNTCGQCHNGEVIDHFMKSVHGVMLQRGEENGPTCSQCHDAHRSPRADVLRNPQFKVEITNTCGTCHADIMTAYADSVHGVSLLKHGEMESASCVDCHSTHEILPPDSPESTVYPTKVRDDCASCHSDPKLIRRFGMQADVVQTFESSYHGQASALGDEASANCASCHNNHGIFASTDERSTVHHGNLKQTCGECHPGITDNFVSGKIHVSPEDESNPIAFFVRNLYVSLIVVVIGGMVLHNIMDFIRKMIERARHHKHHPYIERMSKLERVLHGMMGSSFILLGYTGFALLYPNEWWVAPINWLGNSEEFRSMLHRVCGLVLTFVAIHHLWFLFFHPRGKQQRREFMPRIKDIVDVKDNILWYLGKRKERPNFGRFTYMEKAEYWALIWGTAVMVATGFILWFQEIALMFMPKWLWDVALVIHLYEAILAVLAIIVWHFYYVMVNPDEAPLSLTFLTGRMTHEELAKCHPAEFEQVMKEQEARAEKEEKDA